MSGINKAMKVKTYFFLSAVALFILGIGSCEIINPEEGIPAFLHIEAVDLQTDPGQGTDSHNITDVWLSIDGDFLGVYPLPATIPILEKGERLVSIQPGIKTNGINSTPDIYPFYEPFEVTMTLEANVTHTIEPVFKYFDNVQFSFIEEFEGLGHIFQEIRIGDEENDEISLSSLPEDVFEGEHSGMVKLDSSSSVIEIGTISRYSTLGDNSFQTYLEVNYKSDVPVFFGLVGYEFLGSIGGDALYDNGFVETTEWKKIYFNLSKPIITDDYEEYQVAFQAFIPKEDGNITLDSARVLLDNIKLVHF
jgi:hypothetical protein